jgi:hypothetical protein
MSKYITEPKDPDEVITLGFDFSHVTDTPSNPDIRVRVRWGTETAPTLTKSGPAYIEGPVVYQRFVAGAALHDYDLRCLAYTPTGDRLSVDSVLPVRVRPVV